ncbi:MAG: alpha-ketoglutarate-dependent dioxygenase AlkB [Nitrospira sp.]|nr:alpha-ketoglutarate-dependent dioxygenase AlkB [Nitrospira sp.]MDE0486646.1 alpha-ketoglutarate-dependent dioxygenase AlkB [Nitrospira sp.]
MTPTAKQMVLPMGSKGHTNIPQDAEIADAYTSPWLGLTLTDHRRLLEALEDDWLRPSSATGFFLGIGAYAKEQDAVRSKHPIPISIKLDATKLPGLEVFILRDGQWTKKLHLTAIAWTDTALYWPGALPSFAISELAVRTEEECFRLTGMAGSVSNVELPGVVTVGADEETITAPPPPDEPSTLIIPREVDPLRGAMSMAAWAVPKIQPWLDLLVKGLANCQNSNSGSEQLMQLASKVEASWWRFLPWVRQSDAKPRDQHDCFWLAALDVFRVRSLDGGAPPRELATQIAQAAEQLGCPPEKTVEWREATQSILRAESTIHLDNWQTNPVGVAIQLVLARPEPIKFKTWYEDLLWAVPPAVWWSAATLCGLYRGYRKLDSQFRCKGLRPYIAVRALRTCLDREIPWPSYDGEPRWEPDTDGFAVFWGEKNVARQPEHARGKWYRADFNDEQIRRMAETLAKDLAWPCMSRSLRIKKDSRVPFDGSMKIKKKPERKIEIDSPVTIMLPPDSVIEDVLDVESFRRHVVVAAGRVPSPPIATTKVPLTPAIPVPGLKYVRNFIREDEELRIVKEIDLHEWSEEMQRRVQHYGWQYNYKARKVETEMYLGPLPAWAASLAKRLFDKGLVRVLPNQVIVNEYKGKQGISKHVDSSSFDEDIATISLLESWEMVFRKDKNKQKHVQRLEQRSVAVLTGAARYDWTHEIPQRQKEPGPTKPGKKNPSKVPRGRRLSLTFRKVLTPPTK